MEPDSYSDLLGQNVEHAAQLVSVLLKPAEELLIFRSRWAAVRVTKDMQALHAMRDQERQTYRQARLRWAPALEQNWLARASLIQAARTWSAAAPYIGADPSANAAVLASEKRLRALRPSAMAGYDRLRAIGLSPIDAMAQAAPLFATNPTSWGVNDG